jgi:hypothetical protein
MSRVDGFQRDGEGCDVITLQAEVGRSRRRLHQWTRCLEAEYKIQFVSPPQLITDKIFNNLPSVSVPLDNRDIHETS